MCTSRRKVSDPHGPQRAQPSPPAGTLHVPGERGQRAGVRPLCVPSPKLSCPGGLCRDPDAFRWQLFRLLARVCVSGGPGLVVTPSPAPI